jgi:hypothetical protein
MTFEVTHVYQSGHCRLLLGSGRLTYGIREFWEYNA